MKLRKMLKVSIAVEVERDGDSFYAHCPGLKGLHVDGATEEEAVQNVVEAASLYVDSILRHNDPLPIGTSALSRIDPGLLSRSDPPGV